ncbi:Mov34/MPN/PAD-1 family protein [Ornithinibacillus xuwenensis]|uniref:Mov34/MPN/PAD-1 family protein n=1 Tax=Ornithinibacillus xuwenensis TaxID=3144668 RepID=A0ABU9XIG7_9BACI
MKQQENSIQIPEHIWIKIIEQCKQALPFEACGFLSGSEDGKITSYWKLINEATSHNQFLVSQRNVGETLKKIEAKEEEVRVLYHSHPTAPPTPSKQDIQYHPDEEVMMLIISFWNGGLYYQCYRIMKDNYVAVPIIIS